MRNIDENKTGLCETYKMYTCTFQTSVSCFSPPHVSHTYPHLVLTFHAISDNLPTRFTVTHKLQYFQ